MRGAHKHGVFLLLVLLSLVLLFTVQRKHHQQHQKLVVFLLRTSKVRSYGQFGTQLQSLMQLLVAVNGSGRQVVEPVFFIQPRNNSAYEAAASPIGIASDHFLGTVVVRWSSWLSVEHHRFLPWDEAPGHIDLLLSTLNECEQGPTSIDFQFKRFSVAKCRQVPPGRGLAAWKSLLLDHADAAVIGIDAYAGDVFGESIRWRDSHRPQWDAVLSSVLFSDEIQQAVVQYSPTQRPYACLHWRRGDRAHAEMGGDYGPRYWQRSAPRRINEHLARMEISESLFVMTNSGSQADRDALLGGRATYLPPHVYPDWRDELKRLAVEMGICIASDLFIAIGADYWDCSTPSRLIVDWRGSNVSIKYIT